MWRLACLLALAGFDLPVGQIVLGWWRNIGLLSHPLLATLKRLHRMEIACSIGCELFRLGLSERGVAMK